MGALFHARHTAQTDRLLFPRLDVFVAAFALQNDHFLGFVYPLAVFEKVFRHRLLDEGQCLPAFACTAGAPDAVHIVLVGGRDIVVDDMAHVLHINAARGDVGRNQDLHVRSLEKREGFLAAALIFVAVDGFGFEAALRQALGELFDAVLGAAKDQDLAKSRLCEEVVQNIELVLAPKTHDVLMDSLRRVPCLDRDPHGVLEKVADEFLYVVRECR